MDQRYINFQLERISSERINYKINKITSFNADLQKKKFL